MTEMDIPTMQSRISAIKANSKDPDVRYLADMADRLLAGYLAHCTAFKSVHQDIADVRSGIVDIKVALRGVGGAI